MTIRSHQIVMHILKNGYEIVISIIQVDACNKCKLLTDM